MHLIHPSTHFLIFCLSLIISDIFFLIFRLTIFENIIWLFLALALLIFSLMSPRLATLPLSLLAGFLIIGFRTAPDFISQDYFKAFVGQDVTISGTILKDPDEANITLSNLELNGTPLSGTVFTQIKNDSLRRSDLIEIKGTLSDSFGTYSATMFRPELIFITRPDPGDIFLDFRDFFANQIKTHIKTPESGLAIGYLLGARTGVDDEFQDALRAVGLTHIIVASGAHLGTLISFSRKLFGKISRFASLLAALLLILFFIGITGLSASMLRAGLVTGLSLLSGYVGRKIAPARLIVIVAATTLIVSPLYLTNLAWLLSFASFSGILILSPAISRFFYGQHKKPKLLASTLISSFSASLLCAPVLLYFFGEISLISILANLLVLPTVSVAMGLTFLTGAFTCFLPPLAAVLGSATTFLLDYQISVVNLFAGLAQFQIKIPAENPLIFLLYLPLVVVFFTTFIFKRRKQQKHIKHHAHACPKVP